MNRKLPPYRTFLASDSAIRDLLRSHRVLAFCGLSATGDRDALDVARRLKQRGYRVVPVTPGGGEVLGVEAAADVDSIEEQVGIVVLWRGTADARAIVEAAARRGAEAVWFEVGAEDPESAHHATELGLTAVMGRSVIGEYEMHFPDDELGFDD